ncbi:tmRNA tag peptide, partial [Blattabacterium cuenoti BPAY]
VTKYINGEKEYAFAA